jgi:glycosyltransferase involved in cell wall biosynthesis
VTDQGGPKENMLPGKTGFVISSNDPDGFVSAILMISSDKKLFNNMRYNARSYVEGRSFESAYLYNWRYYQGHDKSMYPAYGAEGPRTSSKIN